MDLVHTNPIGVASTKIVSKKDKAVRIIAERFYDPNFNAVRLAYALNMSRAQLYRMFKENKGVASYIREFRLKHARSLIRDRAAHDENLENIAYISGFRSYPVFSRAFRSHFGLMPREDRRHQAMQILAADSLRRS